ncbi:MAG: autotransporter-associated beta strand repeat-containing protein [Chlamydiia bacterium]|nr:autotransporter-associated beta strand repeat-containing protein [Chlamydiia bacterium]
MISWQSDVNGSWSDGTKWVGGIYPQAAGDTAELGTVALSSKVVNLDLNISIDSLVITGAEKWTVDSLNGSALTFSGASGTALNLENATISVPVTINGGDIKFSVTNPATTAVMNDSLLLNTNTVFDIADQAAQLPDMTVSGVISGTGGVIKSNNGTLYFSGLNTYSGGTTFLGGTILILADSDLGNSAGPLTFNGGTLFVAASISSLRQTTLNGPGTIETYTNTTYTFNGNILGNGSLIKTGTGTLILGGTNSYLGGTTVSDGILQGTTDSMQGDIVNSASVIFDQAGPGSYGGNMSGNGTLTKNGLGTVILSGSNSYTGGTTINSGVLQGTTASLQGDIVNSASVVFDQTGNGTYAGILSGTGSLTKSNTGTVILSGANTYTGGTTVSGGTLQGTTSSLPGDISNGTSVIFDQTASGTYTGVLSGVGSLSKKGSGEVTFTGNSAGFTGATTIEEGSFIVNGTMSSSPFTVNIATLLGGTGSVGTTVNNGTVSPGNSIGTINIVGDYTQNADGSLLVEIDDMGHSDLLIATGTANLDGSVVVTPLSGLYMDGMMYTILQANSVNGAFAQLIESHPADFYLTYFAQSVVLNIGKEQFAILPVSSSSLKGNAKAIGNYLFTCDPNYSPALIPIIDNLLHQKPDEFRQTLLQFGPQDFGALEKTQMQTATIISHSMNQAKDWNACDTQDSTLWLEPLGYYYKDNEKGGLTPYNAKSFGFTTGYKKRLWDHFLLSGGIGYSHTCLNWYENRGDATVQSLYFSPGIAYQSRDAYAGLILQGSRSFYSADRKIHSKVITACYIPCIDETAHNHHKSWDILAGFQGGYRFKTSDHFLTNFYIVPSFHLDYLNIFEEGYRETGAGPINLSVKNKHSAFLRSEFLVRFMKELNIGPFRSFPNIYVGYLKNFALSRGHFSSHFYKQSLCGNHFTVKGSHQNTSQLILGTELESVCFHNISLKIGYEANIGDHYNIQKGHLKGEWNF